MKQEIDKKLNRHLAAPIAVTVAGLLLLVYMIVVEDEPGAIPLLMIITGAGWLFFTLSKRRSKENTH